MLRALIIGRLISLKDELAIAEAKRRFDAYVNDNVDIPADLKMPVYRAVAMDGDDNTFDALLTLYRKSELQEEKNRLTAAMAAMEDPNKIQKVLEFAISDEVRSQDSAIVIIYVTLSKIGRELAWRFLQQNFEELHRRYEGCNLITRLIEYVTKNFASEDKAVEVEEFFRLHPVPSAARSLQQSLESIRLKAEWLKRDSEAVKSF
ncbi:Puromycin-sensitive aminopeptidase-like protein [Leptotrombidium deliense]|uniref:Puromycin-sensitive aminopeptidase-like protein n=1 Tax=Leptotrombidium deliense TaxID=299467 RepID=A0A443RW14_9ACAR|nr:Puromycin-sensitive aminopeptidase-like protein [Leptotrombidium deliense]